jgi:ATP-binding cassette subfamily B (MDR/TAP) protein 1
MTKADGDPGGTSEFLEELGKMTMYMAILGACTFILMYVFVTAFNRISENQVYRLRRKYLEALLRQNVGWYDTVEDRSFVSRMAEYDKILPDAVHSITP